MPGDDVVLARFAWKGAFADELAEMLDGFDVGEGLELTAEEKREAYWEDCSHLHFRRPYRKSP